MTISGRLRESLSCASEPEQRSPLGILRSGRPVWPIFGAEPDDDDADDQDDLDDDEDDEDDESATGADKSKAKAKDKEGDDDDLKDRVEDAEARAARYKKRMQAADRKNSELAARVAALEKGKGEGDKDGEPSKELTEAKQEVESLRAANSTLRVENSFLLNNKFSWHDPEDVLALVLKDEDVEVDEDGNVEGMEAALKRIAKKKPWLVKQADSTGDDDGDDDDDDEDEDDAPAARRTRRPSGGAQNGRRGTKGADRQQLIQTYPALNRR